MKGNNFRRALFGLFFVAAIIVICLAIIIWLVAAKPNCQTSQVIPRPDTPQEALLDNWRINAQTGEFFVQRQGADILRGIFGDILRSKDLQNCSQTRSEVCLTDTNHYKIDITQYSIDQGLSCYDVAQSKPLPVESNDNISTCFDYGPHHWYGAAEVHDQHWPIEKWSIDLQEFVTRDPYFPGYFGSVQERYWLSSAGVAIHVPFKIPLFVSMNSTADHRLCFVSKFKNSVYHNIDHEDLKLRFNLCIGDNITALHTAMADRFWKKPNGHPHIDVMMKPIWSTWAIYKKDINATSLKEYAEKILSHNLSISQLEIDDDWTPHYGDWTFSTTKFPDAAQTMKDLKSMIPAISIWIHPFINTDSEAFKFTADHGMLMKMAKFQTPGLIRWWNPGYAGLLDFSFDNTTSWFLGKLENLKQNFSIDSFKFDAGEIVWMPEHTNLYKPYFHPSEYIRYYVEMAQQADNTSLRQEVRVGSLTQDIPVLVRMLDRRSRWGIENGLKTLIPTALTFGLIGYPFVLPDMIGGNAYDGVKVDAELYIRWLQINVFLPAIQFSIPPWHFNNSDSIIAHTRDMLTLRESYTSLFNKLIGEAVEHGWPIVRPLWWVSPADANCHIIDDEFLLGNDLLVAPIIKPNETKRNIYLPTGMWLDKTNNDAELTGGKWYNDYPASLWQLPYFIRKL